MGMNQCCQSPFSAMIARPPDNDKVAWMVVCRVCGLIIHKQQKEDEI